MFQLVAADAPACPPWAYPASEPGDVVYLGGTYCLEGGLGAEVFPNLLEDKDENIRVEGRRETGTNLP